MEGVPGGSLTEARAPKISFWAVILDYREIFCRFRHKQLNTELSQIYLWRKVNPLALEICERKNPRIKIILTGLEDEIVVQSEVEKNQVIEEEEKAQNQFCPSH